MDDGEETWKTLDFREPRTAPRTLVQRGGTAAVACAVAFVVFLVAIQHEDSKCGQACYDGQLRTHEAGHVWTAYEGAWQWQAQWLMGIGALLCAVAALGTTGRYGLRRQTGWLVTLSALLSAGWIVWRLLEPAVPA
jgi:hypothetical protein